MVRGPAGQLAVSCKSTELKRCSMIEMRWNKYEVFSRISCVNTNSAAEFGNKVQSCGTEDAKVFYCYIEPVC